MSIRITPQQPQTVAPRDLPASGSRPDRARTDDGAPRSSDAAKLDVSDATRRKLAMDEVAAQNRASASSVPDAGTAAKFAAAAAAQIAGQPTTSVVAQQVDAQRVAALLS